uniref:Uncharacterized protein n=1 Tax=Salix viminalis TaxID=40686 RepID=A0A6N2LYD3_SALVM
MTRPLSLLWLQITPSPSPSPLSSILFHADSNLLPFLIIHLLIPEFTSLLHPLPFPFLLRPTILRSFLHHPDSCRHKISKL